MKLAILLLLTVTLSYGQASLYGKKIKGPITLANGDQINVGDTIYFGRGTMPNGNFKFITNPANVLVGLAEMPFDASWRGLKAAITGFRRYENNQFGSKTYVIAYTGRNALIEIEPAIEMGEVIGVGDKQFVVSETAKTAPASVADELLKLKQLLDAGAITQAEYDSQKKKLLGN